MLPKEVILVFKTSCSGKHSYTLQLLLFAISVLVCLGSQLLYWASHQIDVERRSLFFSFLLVCFCMLHG